MKYKEKIASAALSGAEKYEQEQIELLKKLVSIDCGTGNVEGNAAVLELVTQLLSTMKADVELRENPASGGRDVIVRIKAPESTGQILLSAHLDTVYEKGDAEAHPYHVEGEYAYGLGIADCKGGFVVSCYAVKIMQEAGLLPDKDIVMLYTSDEETCAPGSNLLEEELAKESDMVFVFEPARDKNGVLTYRKGFATFTIETFGKKAHAGKNYTDGRCANIELANQILRLTSFNDPKEEWFYNVGVMSGGSGMATVSDYARVEGCIGLPSIDSYSKVVSQMKSLEDNVLIDGCTVKASPKLVFFPMERTEENVKLYNILHEAGELIGIDVPEEATGACGDANHFARFAPCVDGLGPYMRSIHSFDENILLSSVKEKTALFAAALGLI